MLNVELYVTVIKKDYKRDPERGHKHYFDFLLREQKEQSKRKGKKARWDQRTRDYKAYLKQKSIR